MRVYWDSHRYRIAPQIEKTLADKQQDQSLRVLAASLVSAPRTGGKIKFMLRPLWTRAEESKSIAVDRVINTAGPAHGTVVDQNPPLRSLAVRGLQKVDALGLGVSVDAQGQVIGQDSASHETLLVAGPLAQGQCGWLMGRP